MCVCVCVCNFSFEFGLVKLKCCECRLLTSVNGFQQNGGLGGLGHGLLGGLRIPTPLLFMSFLSFFLSFFSQLMRLYAHELTEMLYVLNKAGITNSKVVRYLEDIQKVVGLYKKVSTLPVCVCVLNICTCD